MADTKLADYKTELLNLVAQVRSAGASENTAGRMADLLERIVYTFDGFASDEQLDALKETTTQKAFLFQSYARPSSNPPKDDTCRLYFAAEPGVYTNFPDINGKPLVVKRPCMIFRNLSQNKGNVWSLSPMHGLYEYSQCKAFGESIGWIGGSMTEHAFRKTPSFQHDDFPLKDALMYQLEAPCVVEAKEGAGAVFPPQPHGVPNFQIQAQRIAKCDKYIIWVGTNDCTGKVPIEEFKQGLNSTIVTLRSRFKDCKIMLINSLRCRLNGKLQKGSKGYAEGDPGNDPYSTDPNALHFYAEATKEVANNWELPVLDLYHGAFLDIFNLNFMMDGTHPLPSGYAQLVDQILGFVVKGGQSTYVGNKADISDVSNEALMRMNADDALEESIKDNAREIGQNRGYIARNSSDIKGLSENLKSETDMRTAADKALQEKADDNAREIGQNRGDIARANTEIAAIKTSIGGIDTKLTKILEA